MACTISSLIYGILGKRKEEEQPIDQIQIVGGRTLTGQVAASGSKNASLPLLFSTLLSQPGRHLFYNVPQLRDVAFTLELLRELGCQCRYISTKEISYGSAIEKALEVTVPSNKIKKEARYDVVRKMRASILCLGPLLSRFGEATVSLPGGCAIGTRPIDLHLKGLEVLGARFRLEGGYVHGKVQGGLKGGRVVFKEVTVGGTENVLMAATLAQGTTHIDNAASEPEVVDLCHYLIQMGAMISGVGTKCLTVKGQAQLTPSMHRVIPDRIEAGTLLLAGAITGGCVRVTHCMPEHLMALLEALRNSGFQVEIEAESVTVSGCASQMQAVDVCTAPYPGFPTDFQAQWMALMTQVTGESQITENIFENRFMHVQELQRLNAQIVQRQRTAHVMGPAILCGAPVMATDLRASACLVLAGLVAEGETTVNRIYHLDRGYEQLEKKLQQLGAHVRRITT